MIIANDDDDDVADVDDDTFSTIQFTFQIRLINFQTPKS